MIRAYFGITADPFRADRVTLLPHQQEVHDILTVHSQQGGLCLLMGEPGTGKTTIKEALRQRHDKRMVIVSIARTLHTYTNTIKVLCQAFNIDYGGSHFKCEKRLIEEAFSLNRQGKSLVIIIDDAHLMEINTLRKLRLLFEDFPKNHNIILIGQPALLYNISLKINEDIKSRVTYSTTMLKLNHDDMEKFILDELDLAGLGHNIFTEDAINLIIRSGEGVLRRVKNLCLSCLLEALRCRKKIIELDIVNRVLIQPHWRTEWEVE